MIFLYIPLLYTFHTRLLSLSSKIAWLTTYIIPVFITCWYFKFDYFFSFLLTLTVYTAYELGYIFNDCELIKKEENPTLRLNNNELSFYENNKIKIFFVRSLFLFILLYIIFVYYNELFFYLLSVVFLILFIYAIYNSIRNNFNLPLYSFLVFCRYFIIFILVAKSFTLALFLYLIYPFCVTLEFSTKKRFMTSRFIKFKNFDRFRLFYYLILLTVAVFLYLFSNLPYTDLFLYLAFYFCIYRLLSYLFLSKLVRSE
jgi:hypothetical protein